MRAVGLLWSTLRAWRGGWCFCSEWKGSKSEVSTREWDLFIFLLRLNIWDLGSILSRQNGG